jgi:hypothetical protein
LVIDRVGRSGQSIDRIGISAVVVFGFCGVFLVFIR